MSGMSKRFRCQGFAKPQSKSLFGTLVVTVLVILGSQTSAVMGYVLALSALLMITVALHTLTAGRLLTVG